MSSATKKKLSVIILAVMAFFYIGLEATCRAAGDEAQLTFDPATLIRGLDFSTGSSELKQNDENGQSPFSVLIEGSLKNPGKSVICQRLGAEGKQADLRIIVNEKGRFSQWLPIILSPNGSFSK